MIPELASVISAMGMIQSAASVVALLVMAVSLLRSDTVSAEETERANMRSMSWPAAREH